MKFNPITPPRQFRVGKNAATTLNDCAHIVLEHDEQVTFVTPSGGEYDVTRKAWGFYATPSLNRRLPSFGLRPLLAKSSDGTVFVWLVEKGQEATMKAYMEEEGVTLMAWLDEETFARLQSMNGALQCPCGSNDLASVHVYSKPPEGEIAFAFSAKEYRRELLRCRRCGHFLSTHQLNTDRLYAGGYVDATYGGEQGLQKSYERIMALPPEKSDNFGRVERIAHFAASHFGKASEKRTVLDVGSGLCVFLSRMKDRGFTGTALDPDPRSAAHARDAVGLQAVCGTFESAEGLGSFDIVTLNKVIEHVTDPIHFLEKAGRHVAAGGFLYIEVPDGEEAWKHGGAGREEFFIDHWHVYSAASLALTVAAAGLRLLSLERLCEPSGKFTLRAFAAVESVSKVFDVQSSGFSGHR